MVTEGITKGHLLELYSDPYITQVGHDHRQASHIKHPAVQYLSAWHGGEFAGAFMCIHFSPLELELHALLKKQSLPVSRQLGRECLGWAFEKPIARVTAYVIDGLDTAKNYCLKLGFKNEGYRRDACSKNGVLKGVHVLGMTRADWEAV